MDFENDYPKINYALTYPTNARQLLEAILKALPEATLRGIEDELQEVELPAVQPTNSTPVNS